MSVREIELIFKYNVRLLLILEPMHATYIPNVTAYKR